MTVFAVRCRRRGWWRRMKERRRRGQERVEKLSVGEKKSAK
jgi:hypothetical protein